MRCGGWRHDTKAEADANASTGATADNAAWFVRSFASRYAQFHRVAAVHGPLGGVGLNDGDDLTALQIAIMAAPKAGKPVVGAKGLRKLRFSPPRWPVGKSGAIRVLYVFFERFGIALLCLVYGKNEIDSISSGGKRYINKLIGETEKELHRIFEDD